MQQHLLTAAGSMVGPIAGCIEAAAAKSETSKCAFMDSGVHVLLIDVVRQPGMSHDALEAGLRSAAQLRDCRRLSAHHLEVYTPHACPAVRITPSSLDIEPVQPSWLCELCFCMNDQVGMAVRH